MLSSEEKKYFKTSIEQLKEKEKNSSRKHTEKNQPGKILLTTVHYGLEFGITIFLFIWLGKKTDDHFDSHPWAFLGIGFFGFFLAMYRLIHSVTKKENDSTD